MSSAGVINRESLVTTRQRVDPLLVLGAAALLGTAPLAVLHLRALWQEEQYQYFPFVIGAVLWLLWSRWREAPEVTGPARYPALPWMLVGGASVLLLGAVLTVSAWLAMVSLNVALAAVFWWLGQRRRIQYLWGIWCLLWLLVPLPLGVDDRVVRWLQSLSSLLSSRVLDGLGILHLMSGNVMTLPTKELFVDEACSGIVSVMSVVACSMIYGIYRNRPVVHLVLLTIAGIFWAMLMNVMRISVIAAVWHYWRWDWSGGAVHEVLGLTIFVAVFLALVGSDVLLVALVSPIDVRKVGGQEYGRRLVQLWNWLLAPVASIVTSVDEVLTTARVRGDVPMRGTVFAAGGFAVLGIVQLSWLPSADTAEARAAIGRALAIEEDFLPARIGDWELEHFEGVEREAYSDFGRYSRVFRYRHASRPSLRATVSLDFPYIGGWHDLCMCYRGRGWRTEERNVIAETERDAGWPLVEADLDSASEGHAVVAFTGFDVSGEAAEPPSAAVLFRPWFRLRRRLLEHVAPQLLQVQVFAVGAATSDAAVQKDLRQLLLEARRRFRDSVAGGGEGMKSRGVE